VDDDDEQEEERESHQKKKTHWKKKKKKKGHQGEYSNSRTLRIMKGKRRQRRDRWTVRRGRRRTR
jgi:hypothetical protein